MGISTYIYITYLNIWSHYYFFFTVFISPFKDAGYIILLMDITVVPVYEEDEVCFIEYIKHCEFFSSTD